MHRRLTSRVVRYATRLVARLGLAGASLAFLLLGLGPLTGHYRVVTVLSGSMSPQMPAGSLAITVPEPASALRVGQVISFIAPGPEQDVVTHRVIQILPGPVPTVRTKGDANNSPDSWTAVIHDPTVWRETFALPWLGRAVNFFREPLVHRLTVDAIPALVIVSVLHSVWFGPVGIHSRRRRRADGTASFHPRPRPALAGGPGTAGTRAHRIRPVTAAT